MIPVWWWWWWLDLTGQILHFFIKMSHHVLDPVRPPHAPNLMPNSGLSFLSHLRVCVCRVPFVRI